jgi:hypothetical protein
MQFFRICLWHDSKSIMIGFCLSHWSLMFGYYLEFGAWNLDIPLNLDHSLLDIECSICVLYLVS